MPIPPNFLEWLECPSPPVIAKELLDKISTSSARILTLHNEIRPVDLYCYLFARFGPPNGIQNFLRKDDSDNLIHWEWTLAYELGWVSIQGMSFRTQVIFLGDLPLNVTDRDELIECLKADFSIYGRQMSEVRAKILEKWIEFVNPYFRLRNAVNQLLTEIVALKLEPGQDSLPNLLYVTDHEEMERLWIDTGVRYSTGLGLCFGIRSMLPVMAEAFINLLLFVLMKDDLKKDDRLRENVTRQPIDIRIKSLHINCRGFSGPVDYAHEACRQYHSLVNERNDLLHGNVVISKLLFNEVFFNGRVPVFKEYKTMWERSFGVDVRSVGLDKLEAEIKVVDDLIGHVLTCLNPKTRELFTRVMETRDLGINEETGGLGILFPDHLIDNCPGPH
jgi:hypothetical protein